MPLLDVAMAEEGHLTNEGMQKSPFGRHPRRFRVQAVASFYTMYKGRPTGKYLISCYTSISCMLLGGDVLHAVEDKSESPTVSGGRRPPLGRVHRVHRGLRRSAAVQVNYELIEGVTPAGAKGASEVAPVPGPMWSTPTSARTVWRLEASSGPSGGSAVGLYPAFQPLGTVGTEGVHSTPPLVVTKRMTEFPADSHTIDRYEATGGYEQARRATGMSLVIRVIEEIH